MSTVAISLKMYFGPARAQAYCAALASLAARHPDVASGATELVVLPSFVAIPAALSAAGTTRLQVGAQDLATEDAGAFTGEVSGAELAELGVTHVEVGHAERRRLFGEDDTVVRAKTAAALRNDLVPLLCVGETSRLDPVAAAAVVVEQVASAIPDGTGKRVLVAYEPVWAIGAAEPAPHAYTSAVCARRRAPPSASASATSASSTAAAPAPVWWPPSATASTGCSSGGSPTTRPPSRPFSTSSPPPADSPFARGYAWCAARRCVTSQVMSQVMSRRWRHDPRSRDMRCDMTLADRISPQQPSWVRGRGGFSASQHRETSPLSRRREGQRRDGAAPPACRGVVGQCPTGTSVPGASSTCFRRLSAVMRIAEMSMNPPTTNMETL